MSPVSVSFRMRFRPVGAMLGLRFVVAPKGRRRAGAPVRRRTVECDGRELPRGRAVPGDVGVRGWLPGAFPDRCFQRFAFPGSESVSWGLWSESDDLHRAKLGQTVDGRQQMVERPKNPSAVATWTCLRRGRMRVLTPQCVCPPKRAVSRPAVVVRRVPPSIQRVRPEALVSPRL